jgi:hypothetical protein
VILSAISLWFSFHCIPFAEYEKDGSFIRARDFASEVNFEPMSALCGEDDSYGKVFSALLSLGKEIASDYVRLSWFDALVGNADRHNENCGILRNRKTGRIFSLAPDSDNSLALFSHASRLTARGRKTDSLPSLSSGLPQTGKPRRFSCPFLFLRSPKR